MRFVLAPRSADVQNQGLLTQRPHEAVERYVCVDIEVDIRVTSGRRFQASLRSLRHADDPGTTDDRHDCSVSRTRTERAESPGGLLKETQKTRPRTAASTACNGSCSPSTSNLARIKGLSSVFIWSCGRSSVNEGEPFLKR